MSPAAVKAALPSPLLFLPPQDTQLASVAHQVMCYSASLMSCGGREKSGEGRVVLLIWQVDWLLAVVQ